jgi:hypothetical protein
MKMGYTPRHISIERNKSCPAMLPAKTANALILQPAPAEATAANASPFTVNVEKLRAACLHRQVKKVMTAH